MTSANAGLTGSQAPGQLTDAQAIARLKEVESHHGLYSIRIGRWSVWPLLKMTVMLKMTRLQLSSYRASPSLAARATMAFRDIGSIARVRAAEVLIKTFTSTLVDRQDGKYKDYIFDDLTPALRSFHKIDAVVASADFARRANALVPAVGTTAGPELVGALGARLRPGAEDRSAGETISRVLRRDLGLEECTPEWATFRVAHFNWSRTAYREMFRRLCTRVLVVADPGEHAAVAAARELNLSTVEFQHGLLNADHPGYEYSQVEERDVAAIPMADRFFMFGEYWRRTLSPMQFWAGRLRVAGSLRLDSQRRNRPARRDAATRTIVFTTQGIETSAVIAFLRRGWDAIPGGADFRLIIKLHPIWDADPSPFAAAFAGDSRVAIISGSDEPNTLSLLANADLHLSISSTCHYEACALGVPTVVLPFTTKENMASMVAAGHAIEVQSVEELVAALNPVVPIRAHPEASSFYFEPDAVGNMKRLLDEVLEESGS